MVERLKADLSAIEDEQRRKLSLSEQQVDLVDCLQEKLRLSSVSVSDFGVLFN